MGPTVSEAVAYDPLDPQLWEDPYPTYRRLRDESPVHYVEDMGFFVLSRFSDVFEAATETATFSSAQGLTFSENEIDRLGLAPTLVMMDRPQHTIYRRLVNQMFTPRAVAALEPALREFARRRISHIAQAGSCDFVSELAGPVPSYVVAHYLGVPDTEREMFGKWSSAIVQANATGSISGAVDALTELYGYFTELIAWREVDPGDDMISVLLDAQLDGRRLSAEEILGFCFVMVAGGNDTASGLLSQSVVELTRCREQRRLLVEDPTLMAGAVDELLRFATPVQGLSRTTTREVSVGDRIIPRGSKVHLLYASANRDGREFGPTSEELDLRRHISRMLVFSSGPHHCLGAAAARLQGRVVLEELFRVVPEFVAEASEGRYAPGPFTRRYEYLPIRSRP